jgi:outer membrane receptor for ferrienterochelin and colicin
MVLNDITIVRKLSLVFGLLIGFIFVSSAQQTLRLNGKVLNEKNEPVPSATIGLNGQSRQIAADVEGRFVLLLEPGKKYTISISAAGYLAKTLEEVEVKQGEDNSITIVLEQKGKLAEVVVKSSVRKESTSATLNLQKNNTALSSVISADFIRRTPDKNTGEVLKRVSGASIQDNKFVVIRGLADRYNAALINNAQLPSSEPDKKAFSFDVIPSVLIDNIIINKTATPDLTAEFAGGLVQIQTKDVPGKDVLSVGISFGFNTQSAFRDFVSNQRGSTDFLGIDHQRAIPAGFPGKDDYNALGKLQNADQQKAGLSRLFSSNAYAQKQTTALPTQSYNITYGIGRKLKNGATFGLISGITYRNSQLIYDVDRQVNDFDGTIERRFFDNQFRYGVSAGALLNLSYSHKKTKLSFKNLLNQNFEDNYYLRTGTNEIDDLDLDFRSSFLNQRSLYTSQLEAERQLTKSGVRIKLNGNFSYNWKSQPDLRTVSYARNVGSSSPFRLIQDETSRFFSNLKDYSYGGGGAVIVPFNWLGEKQTLKAGGSTLIRIRDFNSRIFRYRQVGGASSLGELPYDQVFQPQNISENGFILSDETSNEDKYFGVSILNAGYVMMDNKLSEKVRLIWGVRAENFQQFLTTIRSDLKRVIVNTEKWDFLPSVNFTYSFTPAHLLRLAAYQTVARPEFREIAPFSFYDFEQNYAVSGDTTLQRSSILNFDARYEWYPKAGEGISIGVFYKDFTNPIELRLRNPGNPRRYSFQNADGATTFGAELEIRKNLNFLGQAFENMSVFTNLTYITSKVSLSGIGAGGASSQFNRPLQGQSPYLINAGLQYTSKNGNLSSSLLYNRIGQRLSLVGDQDQKVYDIYERPRDQVDFQLACKVINKRGELRLTVADIFNQPYYFYENINAKKAYQKTTDRLWNGYTPGTTISVGFTYDFKK